MTRPSSTPKRSDRSVRSQLARILAGLEFANSDRMSRFLRFAVTEALAGRGDRLKEYAIGVAVFDRPESFDPGIDPIVRVEARRLREKLRKYYETDGRHDDLIIELPKGGYAPRFRERGSDDAPATAPAIAQRPNSVAVLPFVDLNPAADGTYFGDGLTWELIHRLTRIDGLSVVAWNSATQVRSEAADVRAIGEKLQARTVLTGSVRRSEQRLRIVAQLINASTGVYMWSETYDRQVEDVLAIQDEIARAITATLQTHLGGRAITAPIQNRYNFEAYRLYLKGRMEWNQRTPAGLWQSISSFREAAAVDPGFALAYAGIADALALLAEYGLARPAEIIGEARRMAERALEIDPSLAEAHCSLACLLGLAEWRWEEAERHFRRALDLNPGYVTTHHWFAVDHLATLGRLDEAKRELDIARQLDPLNPATSEGHGFLLTLERRYEEAASHYRQLQKADPTFYKAYTSMGRALLQLGRYDEAIEQLRTGRELGGTVPNILAAMGQAYGLRGSRAQARRILSQLSAMAAERYVPSPSFAVVHLGLGETGRALDYLEQAVDQRELTVTVIGIHPVYDGLRDEPRFQALLSRLGLR